MKQIHASLNDLFGKHRIIFWYDPKKEWEESFAGFENSDVIKLRIARNAFGLKKRILIDEPSHAKFLLYSPEQRPPDPENWLLDLLLQGHEFKADRASLAVQELGISYDFRGLAESHEGFFRSKENLKKLRKLLAPDDDVPDLQLKMLAVLSSSPPEVDSILLRFLHDAAEGSLLNPVADALAESNLEEFFWKEVARSFGYASPEPSLEDFATTLFRGANPLDGEVVLHHHGRVFLQRWKDSGTHGEAFLWWSRRLEKDLCVENQIETSGSLSKIGDADAFELFERFVIRRLFADFGDEADGEAFLNLIAARQSSFWFPKFRHGYACIEEALRLRDGIRNAETGIDSVESGIDRYAKSWWEIDASYRRFCFHCKQFGHATVSEPSPMQDR